MKKRFITAAFALLCTLLIVSCPAPPSENNNTNGGGEKEEEKEKEKPPQPENLLGKVLILQVYGTGDKTDGGVSHSFIELYNKSPDDVDLTGHSVQYATGGTNWQVFSLNGKKIPSHSSFLIIGKRLNELNETDGTGSLQLDSGRADMEWPNLQMDNKRFKVLLVQNTAAIKDRNPFDKHGDKTGEKTEGYVDLVGINANDNTTDIDAYETNDLSNSLKRGPFLLSKGKSARRVDLDDTDDNNRDFTSLEWRKSSDKSLEGEALNALRPHSTKDGKWNPVYSGGINENDAGILSLTIGGKNANPGSPAETYDDIHDPGTVTISGLIADSTAVTVTAASGATFRTAKASGNNEPVWNESLSPSYTFSNGDFLYIEVVSANKWVVNVYKIQVNVTETASSISISGNYTLLLNSPYSRERVAIEAYTTQTAGTLIARADADMTSQKWSLQAPSNEALWLRIEVTDSTGYKFGKVVTSSALNFSNDTTGINLTLGPFELPELKTFTMLNISAQSGNKLDKDGVINQTTGVITFPANSFSTVSTNTILDFHRLVANFTLSSGSTMFAGDTEQISGVSANNYYREVNFTVVAEDNTRKSYVIQAPDPERFKPGSPDSSRNILGTTSWQTQGFGIINITTTDKTLGLPSGTTGKLNIVWNPTGSFSYISPEGRVIEGGISIKVHGNWSARNESRKSYSLKLNEKAGFDYYDYKTQDYLTLPEHKRWVLLANHSEGSRIRNSLAFEMGRHVLDKMGWQPHADWVFFFLNETYMGVYQIIEERKIDEGRLNILPEASPANPNGGFLVEFNNYAWYQDDVPGQSNQFVFDDLYNFMTSHQNPVGSANNQGIFKQQGVLWSFKSPDTDLGWYYPDPPEGNGTLSYADTEHLPRKSIVLGAKLGDGAEYTRKSAVAGDWVVPDAFGQPNGMGTSGMAPAGNFGQNNGGIFGTKTLKEVYPAWESSVFVKMAGIIQNAEDAIYAHEYGINGVGGYHDYIDIDSFIDWQIAEEMCSNWEVNILNGQFMYYDPYAKKLKMGILWDIDQAWNTGERDAWPGFVAKIPFWYKELLGWQMSANGFPDGTGNLSDRKDTYYINRLKARWAEVKGQFSGELNPYIDAQDTRFSRIVSYSNPIPVNGNRNALKNNISSIITELDKVFASY